MPLLTGSVARAGAGGLGTRLLFGFYIRDPIAFLFYIQGRDCILCLYGTAPVTQATKQSISCNFSQPMRANKHTPKSQTSLYEVGYLKWESKSEVVQATKHTLSIWLPCYSCAGANEEYAHC
jgi:hypothetical protein